MKWLERTASDSSGKGTLLNNYFCSVYSCSSSFEPVDSESPVVPLLCLDDVNFTVEGVQKSVALLPVSAKASTDGILFVIFVGVHRLLRLQYSLGSCHSHPCVVCHSVGSVLYLNRCLILETKKANKNHRPISKLPKLFERLIFEFI